MEEEAKAAILRLEESNKELREKFDELFNAIKEVRTHTQRMTLIKEWENYCNNSYRYVSIDELEWYGIETEPKGSLGK